MISRYTTIHVRKNGAAICENSEIRPFFLPHLSRLRAPSERVIEARVRRKLNRREREYGKESDERNRKRERRRKDPLGREDDPRALEKVGVAVGRSPDDSLELILRGGFGKGAATASQRCE